MVMLGLSCHDVMKKRKIKLDRQIEKTAIFIVLFANAYSMLRIMI